MFTWRGRGHRIQSKLIIDYAFTNFDYFNHIEYTFNSFSDHPNMILSNQKLLKLNL